MIFLNIKKNLEITNKKKWNFIKRFYFKILCKFIQYCNFVKLKIQDNFKENLICKRDLNILQCIIIRIIYLFG